MARGGHGGKGRHSEPPSRETSISKAMSWLLRHGAEKEGMKLDENGYANVAELLSWQRLASLRVTFPELQSVVEADEKQRFALIPLPSPPPSSSDDPSSFPDPENPAHHLIRANQGHSIAIANENLLTPILASDPDCPDQVVHGTNPASWKSIRKTGGLRPMSRQHVHFALGVPDKASSSTSSLAGKGGSSAPAVISGMRGTATILIWVDVKRSLEGGLKWWRSANGVVLTTGDANKFVRMEWVDRVELRNGDVIWRGGGEGGDQEESEWPLSRRMRGIKLDGQVDIKKP